MTATVIAVASDSGHNFSKPLRSSITLIEGIGVEGDAHAGKTVQHLHDKKKTPAAPNLRQVHLMHAELFDELTGQGLAVAAGQMGENIVTRGVDLLSLPQGTLFYLGSAAVIEITGLRSPCYKLNMIQEGLTRALVEKRADGSLNRKSGVMAVVQTGGIVKAGDVIKTVLPEGEHRPLECV